MTIVQLWHVLHIISRWRGKAIVPLIEHVIVIFLTFDVIGICILDGFLIKILGIGKVWLSDSLNLSWAHAHVTNLLIELIDVPMSLLDLILLTFLLHVYILVLSRA